MSRAWIIALLVATAIAAAAYYYNKLTASFIDLTPEAIAALKAQTAAQQEPAAIAQQTGRVLQPPNPLRNVYFGDLHTHTSLSFDSYLFGNRNGLDDAYRFANGEPLQTPAGETTCCHVPAGG